MSACQCLTIPGRPTGHEGHCCLGHGSTRVEDIPRAPGTPPAPACHPDEWRAARADRPDDEETTSHIRYQGPPLSDWQLAEIMLSSRLRGRSIGDPAVHEEMRKSMAGGGRAATEDHPGLTWQVRPAGIEYTVDPDEGKRLLTWSTLAKLDDDQLDLFEGLES